MATILETLRRAQMNNNPKPMPRLANLPPPLRPAPLEYDPEVLVVAQRQLEAVRTIASLEQDRDEWRRKCLSAEGEVQRLETRIDQDAREVERKLDKMTHDLDYWKQECTRVEAILHAGSRVFLMALEHKRGEKLPEEMAASKAGLAAVADAIEDDDPLPRIVAAGPAEPDEKQP